MSICNCLHALRSRAIRQPLVLLPDARCLASSRSFRLPRIMHILWYLLRMVDSCSSSMRECSIGVPLQSEGDLQVLRPSTRQGLPSI